MSPPTSASVTVATSPSRAQGVAQALGPRPAGEGAHLDGELSGAAGRRAMTPARRDATALPGARTLSLTGITPSSIGADDPGRGVGEIEDPLLDQRARGH